MRKSFNSKPRNEMRVRRRAAFLGLAAVFALGLWALAETPEEAFKRAQEAFEKHNYKDAAAAYEAVLKGDAKFAERPLSGYRLIVCYQKLGQWAQATEASDRFLKSAAGTIWEPRGLTLKAAITDSMPHWGYRKDEDSEVVRGEHKGGWTYVHLEQEDRKASIELTEKARELFLKYKAQPEGLSAQDLKDLPYETIANAFDLAGYLTRDGSNGEWRWRRHRNWRGMAKEAEGTAPEAEDPKLYEPVKAYAADLSSRQKILFLLDEIEKLDPGETKDAAGLALYRRAMYLKTAWHAKVPAAYDPVTILKRVVAEFAKSSSAPDAQYALGLTFGERGSFVEAIAAHEDVAKKFPQCRWKNDAANQIQEIRYPQLSLEQKGPQLPGQGYKLKVSSRNVPGVKFTVHKVKLEDVIAEVKGRSNNDYDEMINALWRGDRATRFRGEQVAAWELQTSDAKDFKPVNDETDVTLKDLGAYLIEAQGGGHTVRQLAVVSDLAITRMDIGGRVLFAVANAVTGKPEEGVDITLMENWWEDRTYRHNVTKLKSGELGLFEHKPISKDSYNLQAFAFTGSRYALTHDSWAYNRREADAQAHRIYATTDRPVYRPDQTVHFKATLRMQQRGEYNLSPIKKLHAVIADPKGSKLYERDLTLSANGTLDDKLLLPKEPALGMYHLTLTAKEGRRQLAYGTISFRVEEYKKPEFEVSIDTAAAQAKIGETVKAKVVAKYYFGAPVTDAKVVYRVFRTPYTLYYQPAGRYDWLYGEGYGCCKYPMEWWGGPWRWWNRPAAGRELILDQTAEIGADGSVEVSFDTAELSKRFPDQDHRFQIEAEVTDASRRTITGSGQVTVTRNQFFVALNPEQNFYRPGDKVKLELAAMTPDQAPVKTKGTLTVTKIAYGGEKNDQMKETEVAKREIETDAEGRALVEQGIAEAGQYKFAFEAQDAWQTKVESNTVVWIRDEDFDARHFRFRDLEIISDKRSYEEGEVAHLMINANHPDAYVVLAYDVGGDLDNFTVLHLPSKSKVLDVKVEKRHMPNFFIQAAMLRDGQLFKETRELFAPPARNFLDVSVASNKAEYRPGEKGTFTFKTRDHKGQPVQTELAFSLFDASTLYIQRELAPEIKTFFFGQRRYSRLQINSSHQVGYGYHAVQYPGRQQFNELYGYPPDYWGSWGRGWDEAQGLGGGEGLANAYGKRKNADRELADGALKSEEKAAAAMPAAPEAAAEPRGENESLRRAAKQADAKGDAEADKNGDSGMAEPEIRSNFADSAAWTPVLLTGADGTATLEVTFPDSLTTWKGNVYGITSATQVGSATTNVVTTKNLLVRLQAPRFFVETDEVVVSANVHNYLKTSKKVRCEIEWPTDVLACDAPRTLDVEVPAGGEHRLDWRVKVLREGLPRITVKALTDEESDAMTMTFPALVHGAEKFLAQNGVFLPDQMGTRTLTFEIPKERNPDASELRVTLSPSLAGAMLDALPYLIDYPYGCCEQTMSRFLPAVVVQATLKDMGLNLEDLRKKRKDLTARELEKIGYLNSPIFDSSKLDGIVLAGLRRLYSFQNGDGGWGWWRSDSSNPNMTAYVLYGLETAKRAGVPGLDENARQRGLNFLRGAVARMHKEKDFLKNRGSYGLEQETYASYVLSLDKFKDDKALNVIWEGRDKLNAYGKALLALTLKQLGDARAQTAYENLAQYIKEDVEAGVSWIETPQAQWWYWYNNSIESNAWTLKALAAFEPKSERGPKLVKYLLNQRRGYRWHSTKDTAMTVYALADYMKATGETNPEYTVTIDFDGLGEKKVTVTKENFFTFDNRYVVKGSDIPDGARKLTIKKDGPGALYFSANLSFFTKEAEIKGAGNEIGIVRKYFKLTPKQVSKKVKNAKGEEIEIKELSWTKTPLAMGAKLKSGDQVEVELNLKAPNDYEYVIIEDFKPAGCEPVDLVSGSSYAGGLCSNMELRDTKVAFFATWLRQGEHTLRYKLRAEIPGVFHALPAKVEAMYAPDVRAIADEMRLGIED